MGDGGVDLARVVAATLSGLAQDVRHIGSTAVPGMAAKPVLDLAIAMPGSRWPDAVTRLAGLQFQDLGHAGVPGRRYLRRRSQEPAANVHLLEPDGQLWVDALLLRDHLRDHPGAAARYAAAKARAARQHPTLLAYSAAKAGVVQELLTTARAEHGGR